MLHRLSHMCNIVIFKKVRKNKKLFEIGLEQRFRDIWKRKMHKILLLFICILGVSLGTQAQVTLNTSLETISILPIERANFQLPVIKYDMTIVSIVPRTRHVTPFSTLLKCDSLFFLSSVFMARSSYTIIFKAHFLHIFRIENIPSIVD